MFSWTEKRCLFSGFWNIFLVFLTGGEGRGEVVKVGNIFCFGVFTCQLLAGTKC